MTQLWQTGNEPNICHEKSNPANLSVANHGNEANRPLLYPMDFTFFRLMKMLGIYPQLPSKTYFYIGSLENPKLDRSKLDLTENPTAPKSQTRTN